MTIHFLFEVSDDNEKKEEEPLGTPEGEKVVSNKPAVKRKKKVLKLEAAGSDGLGSTLVSEKNESEGGKTTVTQKKGAPAAKKLLQKTLLDAGGESSRRAAGEHEKVNRPLVKKVPKAGEGSEKKPQKRKLPKSESTGAVSVCVFVSFQ